MAAPDTVPTSLQLARRWVVDYFNSQDEAAAREFIEPGYTLEIGDYTFAGRDAQWLPAVRQQFDLFPGLIMTVHQVLAAGDRAAVLFTQHGASGGAGGRMTCWSGVAIYRGEAGRLTGCIAQEDYMTRQRQLKTGVPDVIDAPGPAPWDTVPVPPDREAEAVVRQWAQTASWPPASADVRCDDEHITGVPLHFEVTGGELTELFSSGSEVVFHVRQTGRYRGGFPGVQADDRELVLNCNGIVRVEGGQVVSGRVIRDRAGLRGRLAKAATP